MIFFINFNLIFYKVKVILFSYYLFVNTFNILNLFLFFFLLLYTPCLYALCFCNLLFFLCFIHDFQRSFHLFIFSSYPRFFC